MKNTIFILLIALIIGGCKSSGGSATSSDTAPDPVVLPALTPCSDPLTVGCDYGGLGVYVETIGAETWLKDYSPNEPYYYYRVDVNNNTVPAQQLFFFDANCQNVAAEVYVYPLHYTNDVYVFPFEGTFYEYSLDAGYRDYITLTPPYYSKVEGGPCTLEMVEQQGLREVITSGFVW